MCFHVRSTSPLYSIEGKQAEVDAAARGERKKRVYIWSTGGGGHKSVKDALKSQGGQRVEVLADLDLMTDLVDAYFSSVFPKAAPQMLRCPGRHGVHLWNQRQIEGDIQGLERLAGSQNKRRGERYFHHPVYSSLCEKLRALESLPDEVISTQTMNHQAIADALLQVAKEKDASPPKLKIFLTDMPTEGCFHFFESLKKLSSKEKYRQIIEVHTPPPMLKNGELESQFWRRHCGELTIKYFNSLPIREAFFRQEDLSGQAAKLKLQAHDLPKDAQHMEGGWSRLSKNRFTMVKNPQGAVGVFGVRPQDKVVTLMLGSQPSKDAILCYVEEIKRLASEQEALNRKTRQARAEKRQALKREAKQVRAQIKQGNISLKDRYFAILKAYRELHDPQLYFFIYSGAPNSSDTVNDLHATIVARVSKLFPNLNIIPFKHQTDEQLAPLLARSDVTITRSGGATTLELIHLNQKKAKKTLIHTEGMMYASKRSRHFSLDRLLCHLNASNPEPQGLSSKVLCVFRKIFPCFGALKPSFEKNELQEVKALLRETCRYEMGKKARERVIDQLDRYLSGSEESILDWNQELQLFLTILKGKKQNGRLLLSSKDRENILKKEQGHLYIENKKQAREDQLIKEGCPLWEGWNARYLMLATPDAHVVNPKIALEHLREVFQKEEKDLGLSDEKIPPLKQRRYGLARPIPPLF